MAKNLIINGVTYNNVPEVNIPQSGGGTAKFMDTDDATMTPDQGLNGATFYAGGEKKTGNIQSKAAGSYKPMTSDQVVNAQQYLSGAQTFLAVLVSNLLPQYIADGVTVKVGCASDDDSVASVTGTLSTPVISQNGTTKVLSIS